MRPPPAGSKAFNERIEARSLNLEIGQGSYGPRPSSLNALMHTRLTERDEDFLAQRSGPCLKHWLIGNLHIQSINQGETQLIEAVLECSHQVAFIVLIISS